MIWRSVLSLVVDFALSMSFISGAGESAGPIGVSQDGRFFVAANGKPFYLLADTQWELLRRYSFSEAKHILTSLPDWWTLVPDQTVLSAGGNTEGDVLNLGARSNEGKWVIAYIANQPDVTIKLAEITAADSASVKWVDPATGSQQVFGKYPVRNPRTFTRPSGWQDALLVAAADIS